MIEKSVLLPLDPVAAFQLFTGRVAEWWPVSHRPSKDSSSVLHLEASGRFFERAADGREFELGRVVEWEDPHRLVLDFYMGSTVDRPTSVEVTFVPEADGTRVQVRHRAKPESEELWTSRAAVFEKSWASVLSSLVTVVLPSR